ncbi:MAG TPA: aspartate aminotransferase family protein [Pirellulales bacterium]|nr:aspartate aminotransferase family protein [Pirellulales bacterium]
MPRTEQQFEIAARSVAGGVTSSTRFNRALGRPLYFEKADGCRLWDLDGREYLDLCTSHGATLLGHGDARVRAAVDAVLARGAACSYENELHAQLAGLICQTVPCCERVRFTGSGTEATLHCIRLARAYTGRPKLLKFEGNFHGYHDQVMFSLGTPADHLGPDDAPTPFPASSGLTRGIEEQLVLAPYNRTAIFEQIFRRHAGELAAVICEPVWYNAGCILPRPDFAAALRELTRQHDVLLIFDEVLSAFRMAPGGAQEYLKVTPDLCTLGKAVGGGFPLSAFGGRREIMDRLMPHGDCQHSGTYNGHPVSVAAGLAAVGIYQQAGFYDHIGAVGERLRDGLNDIFARHGVPGRVQGLGARFGVYFGVERAETYRDLLAHRRDLMLRFVAAAIGEGVYLHDYGGTACHHGFCAAMTLDDVDEALAKLDRAVQKMSEGA